MCLDVEIDHVELSSGERRARKAHTCDECNRSIEPGERYQFWSVIEEDGVLRTWKMCAHCHATIEVGAALTGCDRSWFWGEVHNLDPDSGGFVGDILVNHDLTIGEKRRVMRCVLGRRKGWRDRHGALLPVPGVAA